MTTFLRHSFLAAMTLLLISACANTAEVSGGNGTIKIREDQNAEPAAKYAATIRILPYTDARDMSNPRKIGMGGEFIYGLHSPTGSEILLDRDVAEVATNAMKQRLKNAGYRVVSEGDAQFEMTGTVKELTYNIKVRDEVSISIASELKDTATGNVLWSGVVVEKKDRFAGVSGDDMGDVAAFLKVELGVVTQKTTDAISAILMAQRPELFNVAAGSKPIAGVTVFSAAGLGTPAASAPAVASAVQPAQPDATQGTLQISTKPARAKIYIGGVYYGLSPLRLEMAPGILEVTATMDGRKKATEKVSVRKGETTEVELTLRK